MMTYDNDQPANSTYVVRVSGDVSFVLIIGLANAVQYDDICHLPLTVPATSIHLLYLPSIIRNSLRIARSAHVCGLPGVVRKPSAN